MGNPIVHFEIIGKDTARLGDFYSRLFGWSVDTNNPMGYGMVSTGVEGSLAGGIGQSADSSFVTVYVGVDDPQAALDEAVRLGGRIVMPVATIPGMVTMAQFADPEGHVIGLVANEPPAS